MSVCYLTSAKSTRLGIAMTAVGLVLSQVGDIHAVEQLHAVAPLHFVRGLCLGVGLAMLVEGRRQGRRATARTGRR